MVQLLAIGPRDSIYQRFNYTPDVEETAGLKIGPALAAGLEPAQAGAPEWTRHPEWFQPAEVRPKSDPLPRKLTPGLLDRWLIPKEHHTALIRCQTEDDLYQANIPDPVLGRVLEALWPPPVEKIATQPDQVLFRPDDLEKYAAGTLRGFLLHFDDDQRRFVNWALKGPTLVKGGPGSGKSTIAPYRVQAVIDHVQQAGDDLPEILFTTFTNALINFSESLLHQLLSDVLGLGPQSKLPKSIRVTTVDSTVMWIARHSGLKFKLAGTTSCLPLVRSGAPPPPMF